MQGIAGSSLALFALAWATLRVLAGALVTDTMVRHVPPVTDADRAAANVR